MFLKTFSDTVLKTSVVLVFILFRVFVGQVLVLVGPVLVLVLAGLVLVLVALILVLVLVFVGPVLVNITDFKYNLEVSPVSFAKTRQTCISINPLGT